VKAEPRDAIYEKAFNTPGRMTICENLWYAPWHFFHKHRLRGGVQVTRKDVYEAQSRLRHKLNNVPWREPIFGVRESGDFDQTP
jgi:hypothetical protein